MKATIDVKTVYETITVTDGIKISQNIFIFHFNRVADDIRLTYGEKYAVPNGMRYFPISDIGDPSAIYADYTSAMIAGIERYFDKERPKTEYDEKLVLGYNKVWGRLHKKNKLRERWGL